MRLLEDRAASGDATRDGDGRERCAAAAAADRSNGCACVLSQPDLTVVLRFTLVIASNGTVKSLIDAGSTRTDPQVSACVQAILRGLVFDGAANETTVTVPLKLTPPSP